MSRAPGLVGTVVFFLLLALGPGSLSASVQTPSGPGENDNSTPAPPPIDSTPTPAPMPSHDWRAPGFVAVVDGRLYDPRCVPLRSVGSNLPNLLFRRGVRDNLEWMRWHQMRWLRVIATGHGQITQHPDVSNGGVERRLADLLREVEAFNAAHDPAEAIYVLVSFTDYYEPGVAGDRYGFDKPGWCQLRVLNAPWYRRGVRSYDFDQECGGGRLAGAPNYEVHYKPWVERIVSIGARSPALLGWQLGNEMKARNNAQNGISQIVAYDWYLDWMRDMVDTIRATDRSHLIFAGAQYLAELVDLPYRPRGPAIDPGLRTRYEAFFDLMLRACNRYCWNVWSLTNYDFRLYAIDDAMLLEGAGVAAVITEFGFTLGTREEELERFGGDRRAAIRFGMLGSWEDIHGTQHSKQWSVLELVDHGGVDGIAPWGSANPDPGADPGLDQDRVRGISGAPEGSELWHIWRETAARLEHGNRSAGASAACLALRSV